MEEEEFKEDLGSLCNLDAWEDSSSSSPQTLLKGTSIVGFVMANIVVSLRYCLLFFTDRESVRLELEPRKPDDQNGAIKVLNADYLDVGYIDRSVATVLYPLIENKMINVEGVVPRASSDGFPCEIRISARLDDFETVKTAISQGGLVLFSQPGSSLASSQAMVAKQGRVDGKVYRRRRIGVNSEPVILYTQEPKIIERGFFPTAHTLRNKPERITDRPAVQVEPEKLTFIPLGAAGHDAHAVREVMDTDLTEGLASRPLSADFEELEGNDYPTDYWSETFPKMLLQGIPEQSLQENEIEMIPNRFYSDCLL